jgi:hypothetical protein
MAFTSNNHNGRGKKKKWEKDNILTEIEHQNREEEQDDLSRQLFVSKLYRTLQFRLAQFFVFYLTLSLFLYAQGGRDSSSSTSSTSSSSSSSSPADVNEELQGVYPLQLLTFTVAVFGIDTATTCFVSTHTVCLSVNTLSLIDSHSLTHSPTHSSTRRISSTSCVL